MKTNTGLYGQCDTRPSKANTGNHPYKSIKPPASLGFARRFLIGGVLGFFFGFTSLFAQAPTEDGRIHFRTFGWQVAPDDLYYDSKGKDNKLTVYNSDRSAFNDYVKSEQIVFYRLVPGPEGRLIHEEAAIVNLAAAGTWPLLIFTKSPDSPKRYRVAAISDDLKSFPFPSLRFMNLTAVDLYAKFGDQTLKISAKGMEVIDPHITSTDQLETRFTQIATLTEEGPSLLYSNYWVVRPTQRTLVFVFPQDESVQIIRIVDDIAQYIPPPPPRR